MDIVELIEKFLESKGVIWEKRKVLSSWGMKVAYHAKDENFKFNGEAVYIPIKLKNVPGKFQTVLVVSVTPISFISHGIAWDHPACLDVIDEYKDILEENNLTAEWQAFCIKNKGLVYKIAVEEFIKKSKLEASDNCHRATIRHIEAIKKETETKNEIFKILDDINKNIDKQFNELD